MREPSTHIQQPAVIGRRLMAPAGLAVGLLVVFHLWLFGRRLLDGALLQGDVALRWVGTFAIVGGWLWLRHRGLSGRLTGRQAVVVWLLILLLHAGAPAITPVGAALQTLPLASLGLVALPAVLATWLVDRLQPLATGQVPHTRKPLLSGLPPVVAGTLTPADFPPAFRRPPPA